MLIIWPTPVRMAWVSLHAFRKLSMMLGFLLKRSCRFFFQFSFSSFIFAWYREKYWDMDFKLRSTWMVGCSSHCKPSSGMGLTMYQHWRSFSFLLYSLLRPNIYLVWDASLSGQVNYINAHATSTLAGDLAEVNAIKKVFKNTSEIKMNGTKVSIHYIWTL